MTTLTTGSSRHLILRLDETARLPESLLAALRDEVVLAGWLRASGVLTEVEIRCFDARGGGPGPARRIAGPVQAIVLEGSIGLSRGDVTCGLRAVLARETDSGLETIAGEIVDARVTALEVMITALDEVAVARQLDSTGVWMLDPSGNTARAPTQAPPPATAPRPQPETPAWKDAVRTAETEPPPAHSPPKPAVSPGPKPSPTFTAAAIPQRPARPKFDETEDHVYPDAGDIVEHFAFGRCEVVKSDGDRLHVRVGKDGRVKEIALEMLKVTPLAPVEGASGKHFRLDRKL
jgi:predicted DNA-binding protein with PD1-like motif